MYTQIFSSPWIFDRCIEIARLINLPVVVGTMGVLLLCCVVLIFTRSTFSLIKKIGVSLGAIVLSFPLTYLAIAIITVVGEVFIGCTMATRYLPAQEVADALNAKLNHLYTYHLPLPQNEKELQERYPELVSLMSQVAKFSYIYNESGPRYTLLVRSSKYMVSLYDSELKIVTYWLPPPKGSFFQKMPDYPPSSPGPWERLPR